MFFGPMVILINLIFFSITYCYDWNWAEKEIKKDKHHSEIIDAINKRNWPVSAEYEDKNPIKDIKGPWGEA